MLISCFSPIGLCVLFNFYAVEGTKFMFSSLGPLLETTGPDFQQWTLNSGFICHVTSFSHPAAASSFSLVMWSNCHQSQYLIFCIYFHAGRLCHLRLAVILGKSETWQWFIDHSFPFFLISASGGQCKVQGVENVIALNGTSGTLLSPKYPQIYPPNMTCTWIITVPKGEFVRLKLTSFYLEDSCIGAKLEIGDGKNSSSDLLKSFCGKKFESSLFSSGHYLWVRFMSPDNKDLIGTGFSAVFEAVKQCKCSHCLVYLKTCYRKSLTLTL